MPARDPTLRSYRVTLYVVYGAFCAVLFVQLLRSVASDIYGHPPPALPQASATACLEDVDRLYAQLAARAVQPAPGGLEGGALAREWDLWTRRWESDVAQVSSRCELDDPKDPARQQLATAVDALEELRRDLALSGESTSSQARQVKDALAQARQILGLKPR
ncbi:MAG TPA: hypothetical protein VG496_13475 [Myxococcales bacterium]|nr:hypothetical protein [Myxococcales bacterium]